MNWRDSTPATSVIVLPDGTIIIESQRVDFGVVEAEANDYLDSDAYEDLNAANYANVDDVDDVDVDVDEFDV